mmetsp:Transcript_741/g.1734  ORF Transcript_741/g.1734 Transcript_741/m.1734 type:complete len:360 (-) Transcript_741:217-1296(-)|eukprot:CAMPEP_0204356390 /NCGR_PEP_ID=MMETSP0469-20131031/34907_1 /ASSEMBLY_ACC=CAM_ASM_000384 /TAXON_ID=2969 /ORGANISM="Oxyrrhis marina" /LENGTH=359 /DNA_ID=CAMNT_0051343851 /DNA_START=58 /DNA_END=1137 /DNA_ORIENTATION=+
MAINVMATTWTRDSHDLFDYETRQLTTKQLVVTQTSRVIRQGTDVYADETETPLPAEPRTDCLVKVAERNGAFYVLPPDRGQVSSANPASKRLWLVVQELPQKGHHIMAGDIIKLGRFKLRVRQLAVSAAEGPAVPELNLDASEVVTIENQEELQQSPCRICLMEGPGGPDDPLITPCSCSGSISYVHLACLRHWMNARLNFAESLGGSYFYKQLPCELCKTPYPAYINLTDCRVPLVQVPNTEPPFIVLENSVRESQSAHRGLHVISLAENKQLRLGRGHESDVRIADVSISRCHAIVRFQRGAFVLEDNNSKFGTLVAMRKTRPIDSKTTLAVQCGRTVLKLIQQSTEGATETQAAS